MQVSAGNAIGKLMAKGVGLGDEKLVKLASDSLPNYLHKLSGPEMLGKSIKASVQGQLAAARGHDDLAVKQLTRSRDLAILAERKSEGIKYASQGVEFLNSAIGAKPGARFNSANAAEAMLSASRGEQRMTLGLRESYRGLSVNP